MEKSLYAVVNFFDRLLLHKTLRKSFKIAKCIFSNALHFLKYEKREGISRWLILKSCQRWSKKFSFLKMKILFSKKVLRLSCFWHCFPYFLLTVVLCICVNWWLDERGVLYKNRYQSPVLYIYYLVT